MIGTVIELTNPITEQIIGAMTDCYDKGFDDGYRCGCYKTRDKIKSLMKTMTAEEAIKELLSHVPVR